MDVPVERVGRQTHFFDIGGHSLSAMRVLARIKDPFRVELGVSEFFDEPGSTRSPRRSTARSCAGPQRARSEGLLAPFDERRSREPARGSHDKVALVTAAAWYRLAIALLLAEHGAKVAINYRDSEAQARLAKEQIEAEGGTAEVSGG